jgi:hypothetical protein
MIVAVAALVFAMTGYAVGVPATRTDRNEVEIQTTTGGPTQSIDPDGNEAIPIADPTFTQRAGEVALVSVDADIEGDPPDSELEQPRGCDLFVSVLGDTGSGVAAQDLGFELVALDQRGDPTTKTADSQALPAPDADREVTLEAFVTEAIVPDEQGNPAPDEGQCDDDTFTVSLDVSVTTLRN